MSKVTLLVLILSAMVLSGCGRIEPQQYNSYDTYKARVDACNWIYTYKDDVVRCCDDEVTCELFTSDYACVLRVWSNWEYEWIEKLRETCVYEIHFTPSKR